MLFEDMIKNAFTEGVLDTKQSEVSQMFSFLEDLVVDKTLIQNASSSLDDLRRKHFYLGEGAVSAYLILEKIILGNIPPRVKQSFTKETLREEIRRKFKIQDFGKDLSFLFLSRMEQSLKLNESFLEKLAEFILNNLGGRVFVKLLTEGRPEETPESIIAGETGFYFDSFNALVRSHGSEFGEERRNKIFGRLYSVLYDGIDKVFGTNAVSLLFLKIYNHFQFFGSEASSTLLDVLPKGLFSSPEWVALLNKGQLEERLIDRTKRLEELNHSLEQKVQEKTADLSNAVANLEKANSELKTKTELLQKRDLALSKANEKLLELDEKKSEFMSVVAHQLRTPLSGLKWTLSMLIKGDLGELKNEQKVFLMKSYESNERMVKLVNDMLLADRIELGKTQFVFVSTNIMDVIDNVLFEIMPLAKERGITLKINKSPNTISKVPVDQEKIRAVFQNLLDNAVKYSKRAGEISISVEMEKGFVKIAVKDEGIGIPENQKNAIFSKFFRARNALKIQTDGTGLGLIIAKSIIEKHGGKIWFESEENKGSTFYFTLKV